MRKALLGHRGARVAARGGGGGGSGGSAAAQLGARLAVPIGRLGDRQIRQRLGGGSFAIRGELSQASRISVGVPSNSHEHPVIVLVTSLLSICGHVVF